MFLSVINLFHRRRSSATQILVTLLQRITFPLYDARLLSYSLQYLAERSTRSLRFRTIVD
jgi:hypothetical protein